MRSVICRQCPKKVSAATFSADGEHAIFSDKFGDVYVAATASPEQVTQLFHSDGGMVLEDIFAQINKSELPVYRHHSCSWATFAASSPG